MSAADQQQETLEEEFGELIAACQSGHSTSYGQEDLGDAVVELAARLAAAETALREIVAFPVDEGKSGGWHFAEVRQIARAHFASPGAAAEPRCRCKTPDDCYGGTAGVKDSCEYAHAMLGKFADRMNALGRSPDATAEEPEEEF